MVKVLVYIFEIATFALIVLYGRRQGAPVVPATLLGLAWLTAGWLFTATAVMGMCPRWRRFSWWLPCFGGMCRGRPGR